MNTRIRELAEQSGLSHMPSNYPDMADLYKGADFELQKFAQLIVEECLGMLDDEDDYGPYSNGIRSAAYRIKKHFGVEE